LPRAGHRLLVVQGPLVLTTKGQWITKPPARCQATFIEPDVTITRGVSVIPSHGHTPGHISVLIESEGDSAVITGDLMHSPCQVGHPDWSTTFDTDRRGGRNSAGLPRTLRRHSDDSDRNALRDADRRTGGS